MPQSKQHNNFASYAVDRAESITLITSLPIHGGECIENCDVAEEKVIFWQFSTGFKKSPKNSLVKLGIWLPYNSSLSHPMQPRQTYSPGFTNGRTDKELRQAINPSAAMLRSGLKRCIWRKIIESTIANQICCKHSFHCRFSWQLPSMPLPPTKMVDALNGQNTQSWVFVSFLARKLLWRFAPCRLLV